MRKLILSHQTYSESDDPQRHSKSIANPAGASSSVQTPRPQTTQDLKGDPGLALTGGQPTLCGRDPGPIFEPLNLIDRYAPPTFSESEYFKEMRDRFVADHHAFGPAKNRHSHTVNLQPFNEEATSLWTCYVCGDGSTEGDVWVQCSNECCHQEVDGWAHARCIGYTSRTDPQAPFLCHQCAREPNAWDQREANQHERDIVTSLLENRTSPCTKISGNDRGQARKKRKLGSQSTYKEEEKKWVVHYLKVEVARRNLTESKWENISKGLARHGFDRSKCSIKAWWSRYGREETGFDERQNPTGRNMVTSKQNPEDRKQARHLRKTKRRAEETKLKQDHVTEEKAGMNQGSLLSQGQEHESVYQEAEKSMIPSSLRGLNRSESGSNLRTE
ncbi:MAG: hypothetical protein Q9200_000994 [Gallowayella weberi]